MQTISIEVADKNDLQLLLLLVKRLGLKIVKNPGIKEGATSPSQVKNGATAIIEEPESEIEYHRQIIEAGTDMSEERLQEMLAWLEEDRQDDSRSNRPE